MEYYGFQHIFDEYSKQHKAIKAEEHDIGKVRDKFTIMVDSVGINIDLLRQHRDEKTGKMVRFGNRQFCFPETICDFCVKMLIDFSSSDFRNLRKGLYGEVAIEKLKFLIDGFTQYLIALGYDHLTILNEKFKMEKRLRFNISVNMFQLTQECRGLLKDAEKCNNLSSGIFYEDKAFLTWYVVEKVKKLRENIVSVYGAYEDLRSEELGHFAEQESFAISTVETLEDIQQSALLADALEQDKEYQDLLKENMEIVCTPDFISKLKTSYNKNRDKLDSIREKHKRELFGNRSQEWEPEYNYEPLHPLYVLHNAIEWVDEIEQEQAETKEKQANITDEQRKKQAADLQKIYLQYFELPDIKQVERKIEKKGEIKFACCPDEKTIVYEGATGGIVSKCPRCGKQVFFNLEEMTAALEETPKGHMNI